MPILEVASRLGIGGLVRQGAERVGPCPVCGGRDRFGINPARGLWTCRVCDKGGDGLALVQHALGCDFRGALDFLLGAAEVQRDPAEVARLKAQAAEKEAKRKQVEETLRARAIRDAREIWASAAPGAGTPAEAYLAGRGITFATWPPTLRYIAAHPYMKAAGRGLMREHHRGPCMVAAVQSPEGRVTAVHQTWINAARPGEKAVIQDQDGQPMPAKLVRGSKKGGAIRLTAMDPAGRLVMAEGIETTASALVAGVWPGATFWAGVDLGNMSGRMLRQEGVRYSGQPDLEDATAWVPPEGITRLLLIRDGDSEPKMTRAKLLSGARRAMIARPGLKAEILAAEAGADLNDMLRKEAEKNGD